MKVKFLKKRKIPSEKKFYNFSLYTLLKYFALNFFAGLVVYCLSAIFIYLPAKEILKTILYPVIFIAIGVSALEVACHLLITKGLSSNLLYWKLHKLSVSDNTSLLRKVQSYPMLKGFEVFVCFLICATLMLFYLINSLNIDRKITAAFFVFIFELSYLYGMIVLDLTNRECSSIASEIVKSGVKVDEASLNYKNYNIFSFVMYIGIPTVIAVVLFMLTANLTWKPTIIHTNEIIDANKIVHVKGSIASKTLNELEKNNIFIMAIPPKSVSIFRITFAAVVDILSITSLAFIYFGTTIRYNQKLQKKLEELSEQKTELKALNLPVNKYREASYTIHLLDKAIFIFNNYTQKNSTAKKNISETLQSLSKTTKNSINYTENLKSEILPYLEKMQTLKDEPESNKKNIDDIVLLSSKMIENINWSFAEIEKSVQAIQEITNANKITIKEINSLSEKISNIWEIVDLIRNIASQTKIIAFNAELETNNSSKDSQKFKKIAQSIRSLADRTNLLTTEIRQQMQKILDEAKNLTAISSHCMNLINDGNRISNNLSESFYSINSSVSKTKEMSELTKQTFEIQSNIFTNITQHLEKIKFDVNCFFDENINIEKSIDALKQVTD